MIDRVSAEPGRRRHRTVPVTREAQESMKLWLALRSSPNQRPSSASRTHTCSRCIFSLMVSASSVAVSRWR